MADKKILIKKVLLNKRNNQQYIIIDRKAKFETGTYVKIEEYE